MASRQGKPELADGYMRIANELLEAISRAKFTIYERSLIDLILRLSYGCSGGLYADLLHWSDMEVVGIAKQKARQTAEQLKKKKIIRITHPNNRIRLRLNKYYLDWDVDFAKRQNVYERLIRLNLNDSKPLEENGKQAFTLDNTNNATDNAGLQANGKQAFTLPPTPDSQSNPVFTQKVNTRLPKSNPVFTATGSKPAISQGLQPPKEKKERYKEIQQQDTSNIVSNSEGQNNANTDVVLFDNSEEETGPRTIASDITRLSGMILNKWPHQLTAGPSDNKCRQALEAVDGDIDVLLEAIERAPAVLKAKNGKAPTEADALNFVVLVAQHPTWYIDKQTTVSGLSSAKRDELEKSIRELTRLYSKAQTDMELSNFYGVSVPSAMGPQIVNTKDEYLECLQMEIERKKGILGR